MNPQAIAGCAVIDTNLNYLTFNGNAAQISDANYYTAGTLAGGAAAGWSSGGCTSSGPVVCEFAPICPPPTNPQWSSPPAKPTCE